MEMNSGNRVVSNLEDLEDLAVSDCLRVESSTSCRVEVRCRAEHRCCAILQPQPGVQTSACRKRKAEKAGNRTWVAGQRVLVWRIGKNRERSRWVGPGLVILQNGHTVCVAMRSRL